MSRVVTAAVRNRITHQHRDMAGDKPTPSSITLGPSTDVREGYICPICMTDLGSILQLQTHFEGSHSNEDRAVLHSLKDLFGKAKKKILKNEPQSTTRTSPENNIANPPLVSGLDIYGSYESQALGATRCHTMDFAAIRESRSERYSTETSRLLMRLDRLILDAPVDSMKRKAHEKAVVFWVEDQDVRLCPGCGKGFTIARRRHHCRLCGAVMCADCSVFINYSFAKKLTSPPATSLLSTVTSPPTSSHSSPVRHSASSGSQRTSGFPLLTRSGSSSSLNSLRSLSSSSSASEPNIRLCIECKKLLDRRDRIMEYSNSHPPISQLYERLQTAMDEAAKLCPLYTNMAMSLNAGESNFTLTEATTNRIKLMRLAESIDRISKQILVLGAKEDPPPSITVLKLQRGIRKTAASFLQENMIGMASLPTEEELEKLQARKKLEIQNRIAQEKQQALELQQRLGYETENFENSISRQSLKLPKLKSAWTETGAASIDPETGWGPEFQGIDGFSGATDGVEDPLIEQMNIIRNYIKQAQEARRFDELHMLENNLLELQKEFYRQRENES